VSELSRQYITNLLGATVVRIVELQGDSSEDSDAERWAHIETRVGHMDVVRRTLDGIAARSEEMAHVAAVDIPVRFVSGGISGRVQKYRRASQVIFRSAALMTVPSRLLPL
jgi:hypothetical protein